MKDLTVFHTTYRELLQQGRTWAESFCEATEAQDLFDKYIAEQIEASRLQPVDAKTGVQGFTEALKEDTGGITETITVPLSTFDADQAESFYWKPVSEFSEGDALRDSQGYVLTLNKAGTLYFYNNLYDLPPSTKYLARKPEAFAPCWDWVKREDVSYNCWITSIPTLFVMDEDMKNKNNRFYFEYKGDVSNLFQTLEAAQIEAERYYRLYIEPTLTK